MIKQTILLLVLFSFHVIYSQQEHEEAIATAKLFIDEGKDESIKTYVSNFLIPCNFISFLVNYKYPFKKSDCSGAIKNNPFSGIF